MCPSGSRRPLAGVLVLGALLSCPVSPCGAQLPEPPGPELLVLAASSLTDALPQIAGEWGSSSGARVRFSFDATSRLAPQAAAGAPADVFVSADDAWMSWLVDRGVVDERAPRVIVRNQLVVVVPAGSERPAGFADLATVDRIGVAGENVPAGRYALNALEASGALSVLRRRLVTGGSVRGVLEWVARGEVDAGVVYRTDAVAEPAVSVAFAVAPEAHDPIRYWAAPLLRSRDPAASQALVTYLVGPGSIGLISAGFLPPASEDVGPEAFRAAREALAGGAGVGDGAANVQSAAPASGGTLPSIGSAIRLSLFVALLATIIGLAPALALGWLLARRSFRGKSIVSTLVLAPLVIPPVVTGFLLLSLFGTGSPFGRMLASLGLPVPFTMLGATIAAFVVGFPLYVLSIRGSFEAVDPLYEELSWTLGVPPARTFLRISLPLALPGIASGAILAFARALGEFGATVVLAGNVEGSTRTIALAVYTLLEAPAGRESTWVLVGASVALSLLALLGFETLSRRQRRRMEHDHGR